jgi:hypothetical protein
LSSLISSALQRLAIFVAPPIPGFKSDESGKVPLSASPGQFNRIMPVDPGSLA